jgi:hypothetical protein
MKQQIVSIANGFGCPGVFFSFAVAVTAARMHIEEIILDGFKSYATRTSIAQWDPSFNAITGLNGSGKSNILDAICFVLGISNLSQVPTPAARIVSHLVP